MDQQLVYELHPLLPFLPKHARILMLGSFPPPRAKWSIDFYYPNFQNDMWRIFGIVFGSDRNYFLTMNKKSFDEERIRIFLTERGIALSDTAQEVIRQRGNASDQFLEVVRPIDLKDMLNRLPECRAIVTTGQKATDTLIEIVEVEELKVGGFAECVFLERKLRIYRMPSSSRAYPKPLEEKAEIYRKMFRELELL